MEKNGATQVVIPTKALVVAIAVLSLGTVGGGVSAFRTITPADVSKQIADEAPSESDISKQIQEESPVSMADVSLKIAAESPYVRDRALIMHQLAEYGRKEAVMFEKIDAIERNITDILIEQRTMKKTLDRIEKSTDQ